MCRAPNYYPSSTLSPVGIGLRYLRRSAHHHRTIRLSLPLSSPVRIRQTNVRLRLNNNIIIIKRRPRECISPPSKCVTSIPVKSVALSFRAAFNAKKITGVRDPGDAPFRNFLRSYVGTVPGSTFAKFEVRSFNHFGAHCPCSQLQWPSSCYVVRQ